jgi:hypothetical protein
MVWAIFGPSMFAHCSRPASSQKSWPTFLLPFFPSVQSKRAPFMRHSHRACNKYTGRMVVRSGVVQDR